MPRRESPRLAEAVPLFLAHLEGRRLAQQTRWAYVSVLHRLADRLGPARRVSTIRPEEVADHLTDLIADGLSLGAASNYRQKIHMFGRFCHGQGWTAVPNWTEQARFETAYRPTFIRLDATALVGLLDLDLHPRDRALLAVAMNTALRITEITNMKIADIDLAAGRLRVRRLKKKTVSIDYLPITADLEPELRRWLWAYETEVGPLRPDYYAVPAKRSDTFTYEHGYKATKAGPLLPAQWIRQPSFIARHIFARAGLAVPSGEAWHVFRRSVARAYFDMISEQSGYNHALRRTAALLGHNSTITTERYLGLDLDREARDADLAGQPFLSRIARQQGGPAGRVVVLGKAKNEGTRRNREMR